MERVVDPTAFPPKVEVTVSHVADSAGPVRIFVRKGSYEGERVLSFSLPEGLKSADVVEIIRRGFAIDGNRAVMMVTWYSHLDPDTGRLVTEWKPEDESGEVAGGDMGGAHNDRVWAGHWFGVATPLHEAELSLVEWLSGLGYAVEFK